MSTLVEPAIPAERAWNTWSKRPAELVFLPLGVRITPVLYSSSIRKATAIPSGKALKLGRHTLDGKLVEFQTSHGGTIIDFCYYKQDPYSVLGSWTGQHLAEWGLRYWLSFCVSTESGDVVSYLLAEGATVVRVGHRFVAIVSSHSPVQVTTHASVDELVDDFDHHGYFHTASRGDCGQTVALRFNLEMMREGRFAAAVADSENLAIIRARNRLTADTDHAGPLQSGRYDGALDAVRDVMAWNTVYDGINHRPYTAVSRIWNLGEFAVWYNDQTYAALLTGLLDCNVGRDNIQVAMGNATPQGNFACILTSNDAWVDRSQAPNGAFIVWTMYLRSRDRSLLRLTYGCLARNHRWWRIHRDPGSLGLVSCGTSDVGEALYKGTHFGARNETGMDNSPTHDEAIYDPLTRTLSLLDVGLNSSLTLDAEMLSLIAQELDLDDEAVEFATYATDGRELIREQLWDASRQIFANRHRDGGFVRSLSPTSFFPMICGAASRTQAESLLKHLKDPEMFGGDFVIPNVTRSDPAFLDNVYWRGRIWPNVNFFVWHALRRYGFERAATALADKSVRLFNKEWPGRRMSGENYNSVNGAIDDQPDTDTFLSWGAMLPALGVAEVMDCNPWNGWQISSNRCDVALGPIESPIGSVRLICHDGVMTLWKGKTAWLRTDLRGRLSHIHFDTGSFSCGIKSDELNSDCFVALPHIKLSVVKGLYINGEPLSIDPIESGFISFRVPSLKASGSRIELFFSPFRI